MTDDAASGKVADSDQPTCATCGESVFGKETRRVKTWVDGDSVTHVHFCDEDCRDEWDGPRDE